MGEEAFHEIILAADTGTLTVRGGYGRDYVFLGISEANDPDGDPLIGIALTPRQQRGLLEALGEMTAVTIQDMRDKVVAAREALEKLADIDEAHFSDVAAIAEAALEDLT